MLSVYLLPCPFRGYTAPFLWVYYRMLTAWRERAHFMASRDYLQSADVWQLANRWEVVEGNQMRLGYRLPSDEDKGRHLFSDIGDGLCQTLVADHSGNPVAAFRSVLTKRMASLEKRLSACLDQAMAIDQVEAVLAWCNCPSLSEVAHARGIPVVHIEMGPIRHPDYGRETAYFDFQGVNGNTEAAQRYQEAGWTAWAPASELADFFLPRHERQAAKQSGITGLALQVEDDSNLIAFSNGYDNQSLIVRAHCESPSGQVLVRGHPGSLFQVRSDWYTVDQSPSSIDFIGKCDRIMTINSSVGLEAILLGREVIALGDSSYRFILDADDETERMRRLTYYVFAYLIPMALLFDPEYVRFRLEKPSEEAIVTRHLDAYMGGSAWRSGVDCTIEALIRKALATGGEQVETG